VTTSPLRAEFLADLSHELRTPLSGIIGFAELMNDRKLGPLAPNHQEYLGDILGSARHLHRLLNELLDLAKVEAGTLELRPQPVDVSTLLEGVCDALKTLASQKGIDVTTTVAPDVTGIVADPARLEQILRSTITTALKGYPIPGPSRHSPDLSGVDAIQDRGGGREHGRRARGVQPQRRPHARHRRGPGW
jgi:K+-sensing histidine kinase KdpD